MDRFQGSDLGDAANDRGVTTPEGDNPLIDYDQEWEEDDDSYSDSDYEEDLDTIKYFADTSAREARHGKDVQGIPWGKLSYPRDKYRETRLKEYKNYENLSRPRTELEKECKQVERNSTFYDFQFNTRLVKPTVVHFQLRNLLWATSKHDVYLPHNYSVMHWSSLLRKGKEVLDVSKQIIPKLLNLTKIYCLNIRQQCPGLLGQQSLWRLQISSMSVKDNLMVAGGFHGELICKHINHSGVAFCTKLTSDENAITNTVDIYNRSSGSTMVTAANNDAQVRIFDAENFYCTNCFFFPWSVNNTSVSPDGKLIAVLGDSPECFVAEAESGKVIGNLKGHLDYSFASAWHPDGRILATGNQDTTCRLWDTRKLSESMAVLKGNMGAIRSLKFTTDGRFMAMAEPADFVHVFDTRSGYANAQVIDLFGEIAGISFSPDTEALFVGVADRTYGSLLEFDRRHYNYYLDSIL